jgi:phenylpropionate dioxygenase-like ring-hydroxylating dioxygenase large terminal subunit
MSLAAPAKACQILPVEAYVSADWYAREQRELFGRAWVFAGMTEDFARAGDYRCQRLGGSALIVLRDDVGQIRAFHNVCRHRGARLLEQGQGNLGGSIVCFYHRWTYDLAGRLNAVSFERNQFPELDKSCLGLKPVQVGVWKNLVFVNPDANAEPFEQWLAGVPQKHDRDLHDPAQTSTHDPERLVEVSDISYRIKANWKIVVENFIDGYHLPLLHRVSLADGDFTRQRWEPTGRHIAFYRPLKPGISHDNQPVPPVEGVPGTFGAAYYWLFPNVALFETATSWSTFHVVPVGPAESIVHSRMRVMPEALKNARPDMAGIEALPSYVIRAKGKIPEEPIDLSGVHPLKSDLVMVEDIYACEAMQAGLESGVAEIGPLSRWEAPMTFFQRHLLDFMPGP